MERVVIDGVFRQEAIFEQEMYGRAQVCPVPLLLFLALFARSKWVLCVSGSQSVSPVSQEACPSAMTI